MKKIKLIPILIFIFTQFCFSQDIDLKNYYDVYKGFSGAAGAMYLGTTDDVSESDLNDFWEIAGTDVPKLTKNNMWLCKKALNEWDYEADELYLVLCAESVYATKCIMIFVKITGSGEDDFLWKAKFLTEEDVNTISEGNFNSTSKNKYSTEERVIYDWYTDLNQINTTTCDTIPAKVTVKVAIGYTMDDEAAYNEIVERKVEIEGYLTKYFSTKTTEDLKPQNEEIFRQQLCNDLNNNILTNSKIKDIRFTQKDVVKQ